MGNTEMKTCKFCGRCDQTPCSSLTFAQGCIHYGYELDDPEANPVDPKHYHMAIEPIEFISKNGLDFNEGCVIKYVSRHRKKGGAEDIRKAIQYCQFILKYQYPDSE